MAIHEKPNLRWDALTPTIITTTLATAVVFLRLLVRCKFVKAVGFDDLVIMASLVSAFAHTSCQIQAYEPTVPFLGCPWPYCGYGHDRIWQLRLDQPSRLTLDDRQTLPQLERPLCRSHPRHQSFDLDSIPSHLSHSYNATTHLAFVRGSCSFGAMGRVCFHLLL
jgi:hypothetical protein